MAEAKGTAVSLPYDGGLLGAKGGEAWSDGTYSSIRQITVKVIDDTLTWVQFNYSLQGDETVTGRSFRGPAHGGSDGDPITKTLNENEYVKNIHGYRAQLRGGPFIITSLTFETNERFLGPFGTKRGIPFQKKGDGKIVGFHGRASKAFVYSIDIFKVPQVPLTYDSGFYRSELLGTPTKGGEEWNDGTYSGITEITVTVIEDRLTSVQFTYFCLGTVELFQSPTYGGSDGEPKRKNTLYPTEYLTKISGYYDKLTGGPVILTSLTFETNQRRSIGPFGAEKGNYFEKKVPAGSRIVGFHGRASTAFVYSIGFYAKLNRFLE